MEELKLLEAMSNRYGADPRYVLAGGGNTSYKNETTLYVKGSGTSLATIKAEDFVRLDRAKLSAMWDVTYSANEAERESQVLSDMMAARLEGETRRPSVETLLHNLFPRRFVLHVHPAAVNGMTCGKNGKAIAAKLFPESVWVDACRPGYILAAICREELNAYRAKTGKDACLLFLQNHGVFFAGDTVEEIDALVTGMMNTLDAFAATVKAETRTHLCEWLNELTETKLSAFLDCGCVASFDPAFNSPTPDHIVYCKANYLTVDFNVTKDELTKQVTDFKATNNYNPRVILVKGEGAIVLGTDEKQLNTVKDVFLDQVKVFHASRSFGGYFGMSDDLVNFIVNWEVESYRAKVSAGN
ncbi:MAG: class II aldolase/adducin family protein [Clostridia bacterium]|nr:class II aldolase/adducin family protein [Clostridia bacterium]